MRLRSLSVLLGIIVAAIFGVLAGRWFISWRSHQAMDQRVAGLSRGESTKLRVGQMVPNVKLLSVRGGIVNLRSAVERSAFAVVVISLECTPCVEALLEWRRDVVASGEDPHILVVCDNALDEAATWARETDFPFPVYSDAGHVLSGEYEVTVFPTVIGVQADGRIVSIRHGIAPGLTPEEVLKKTQIP